MTLPDQQEIDKLGKYFAIESNNEFWQISENEITEKNAEKALTAAFTSLYHWQRVGNDDNKYLAYLAVARALAINNMADLAIDYAARCYDFFKETDQLWIKAFINAILSHANLIQGKVEQAASYYQEAKNIGSNLQAEDLEVFNATFRHIPDPES